MTATPGRIVQYVLSADDAERINSRRVADPASGNPVIHGGIYPAMVVQTFGGPAVNLQVFLDGGDSYWATSRNEDAGTVDAPDLPAGTSYKGGTWHWPERT